MKFPYFLVWSALGFLFGTFGVKRRLMTPAVQRDVERRLDNVSK